MTSTQAKSHKKREDKQQNDTKEKRKRQISTTACLECQSHHRACVVERPCFQCVRFGLECTEGKQRTKVNKKRITKKINYQTPSPASSSSPEFEQINNLSQMDVLTTLPTQDLPLDPAMPFLQPTYYPPLVTSTDFPSSSIQLLPLVSTPSFALIPPALSPSPSLSPLLTDSTPDTQIAFLEEILFPSLSTSPEIASPSSPLELPPSPTFHSVPLEQPNIVVDPERPLMITTVATAMFRMPDGILLDFTRSLREILKWGNTRSLTNFDEITPPEEQKQRHLERASLLNEKGFVNKVGFKTLVCGDGKTVTFMSCCMLIHVENYAVLQSTIWNTAA